LFLRCCPCIRHSCPCIQRCCVTSCLMYYVLM
jgi:hypothetical protein